MEARRRQACRLLGKSRKMTARYVTSIVVATILSTVSRHGVWFSHPKGEGGEDGESDMVVSDKN